MVMNTVGNQETECGGKQDPVMKTRVMILVEVQILIETGAINGIKEVLREIHVIKRHTWALNHFLK